MSASAVGRAVPARGSERAAVARSRDSRSGLGNQARLRARAARGPMMGRASDAAEREAGAVSAAVTLGAAPRPLTAGGPETGRGLEPAPPVVAETLAAPGRPLDGATRAGLETRLGADLGDVRVHTDAAAARSAAAVGALAYTVGADIVFAEGRHAPGTAGGRHLLAHEIAHVLQARRAGPAMTAGPVLRRFEASEAAQISKLDEVLATATTIGQASSGPNMFGRVTIDWGDFVRHAGGFSATDKASMLAHSKVTPSALPHRYLVTCRCGMVDMRHFYQLMYITRFFRDAPFFTAPQGANATATDKGREHELTSEATSRFAAEDTPSNALGALLGSQIDGSGSVTADQFTAQLRGFLAPCLPIDFAALPAPERQGVVDYYGGRDMAGVPLHQNETATPAANPLSACSGKTQAFPFTVAAGDPDRKTLSGVAAPYNLTGDGEIRDWVGAQACAAIADLPGWEMSRLVNRLLDGWVSDADVAAIETICGCVTAAADMASIAATARPRLADLHGDAQRARVDTAISRVP